MHWNAELMLDQLKIAAWRAHVDTAKLAIVFFEI